MATVHPNTLARSIVSAKNPTKKDAGAPSKKKAKEMSPPNLRSRSSSSRPKSSAMAVKLGDMRFWSANNKTVVVENKANAHRRSNCVVVEVVMADGDVAVEVVVVNDGRGDRTMPALPYSKLGCMGSFVGSVVGLLE